ncbi:hypothetical protein FRC05_001178 [Tulasnella sp. 425]|nr:hypothetical protein FRC05_001178 [Tulasnella sp. 425]
MSQVRNFNGRYRIKSKGQVSGTSSEPLESEDFWRLDRTIHDFTEQIPSAFREPVDTKVDPLLYMAHLLPHVAMIQLHDPHADFYDPGSVSTVRLVNSVDGILDLIHKILATSYDLIYLDHATSFCWFVGGATIIRCLKVATERDNQDLILTLTRNLQTVKFVLGNLGERTTVGLRQIKLLNDLYDDEITPVNKHNAGQLVQSHGLRSETSASISEAFVF